MEWRIQYPIYYEFNLHNLNATFASRYSIFPATTNYPTALNSFRHLFHIYANAHPPFLPCWPPINVSHQAGRPSHA